MKKNELQKQVDFFSNRVLFCVFLLSFQQKVAIPFHARHRWLLLARADTHPNGHAPAHRALNDFAFLAFTLHLHTQPSDNLPVVSEQKHDFNTSQVKVKQVKPSPINTYSSTFYPTKVKR